MAGTLETMSWMAAVVAVPVAIFGWFLSGKQKTNKAAANNGGTAISGDVNVSLTVSKDARGAECYERRYAIFDAVGRALNEALCHKMISPDTFRSFSKAITDSRFLLGDDELVAYLNEVRKRAAELQAITISMEAVPFGDDRARACAAAGERRRWLIDQIDGLPKKFEPVLRP